MRLVIFDGSFKTTTFINRLIQGLVKQGFEVFVLGFNEELQHPLSGVTYVRLGSSQSRIKFVWTSLKWSYSAKVLLKTISLLLKGDKSKLKKTNLNAALNRTQPDIVHLQWVSNIKLFEDFLEEKKYKFILSQRGYQTNVRPFVNSGNYSYLRKWLSKFDGFHSVSQAISKVGDQIYAHQNKIDQVVYTGLDLSKFEFNPKVLKNEKLQLISVGRPHWIKGYDYALKACAILHQQGVDFKFTVIGAEGDEELLFLIDDLGLTGKVLLTSKLPQHKVFKLMQTSNLFLSPSLEEGIANVVVEAMALGTPVISTNCGGMSELITHCKEGCIVSVRDSEAMAEQILNFTNLEEDEMKHMKMAARNKVETQHNEEKMVKDIMNLYKEVNGLD